MSKQPYFVILDKDRDTGEASEVQYVGEFESNEVAWDTYRAAKYSSAKHTEAYWRSINMTSLSNLRSLRCSIHRAIKAMKCQNSSTTS